MQKYAVARDLAHDRPIGNGRKARIVVVVLYRCILTTIRASRFKGYLGQIDLSIHDPPRCPAQCRALNMIFIADEGDARFGLDHTRRMANMNGLLILRFRTCHFVNNSARQFAGNASADRARSSVGLVHLLHEHQARDEMDGLCLYNGIA